MEEYLILINIKLNYLQIFVNHGFITILLVFT